VSKHTVRRRLHEIQNENYVERMRKLLRWFLFETVSFKQPLTENEMAIVNEHFNRNEEP
jgi:hypothetical protein